MHDAVVALLAIAPLAAAALLWRRDRNHNRAAMTADPLASLIAHRYVVTLRGDEGDFVGVRTDQRTVATGGQMDLVLTFDQCKTMATHDGDTVADIAGRVILVMSGIAYLQQVG